jgi:hypothetical protein
MRIVSLAALAFVTLSLACDTQSTSPADARQALLRGSPVAPGGLLSLEYTNATGMTFGVNPCTREFQEFRDGAWGPLVGELRSCADETKLVPAGAVTTLQIDVPTFLTAGTYRFRLAAQPVSAPVDPALHDIVTPSFEVRD